MLTAVEAVHQMTKRPLYLSEKSIQARKAKEGLSFLEARTEFLESQPKDGNQ